MGRPSRQPTDHSAGPMDNTTTDEDESTNAVNQSTNACCLHYRDLLLALHNVPQEYDEAAIRAVLQELTPANVRIMWSSKLFQVSTVHVLVYLLIQPMRASCDPPSSSRSAQFNVFVYLLTRCCKLLQLGQVLVL